MPVGPRTAPRSLPAAVTHCKQPALDTCDQPSPVGSFSVVGSKACKPMWMSNGVAVNERMVVPPASVFADVGAGAGVAVGGVMAHAAAVDVAARHHLGGPVGQQQAVELAGVAVDAVALAELALRQAPAPLVAEERVGLLQVH